MHIIWHGHSCFQIISPQGKEEKIKMVIDPFGEKVGLRVSKLEADILLITHSHDNHSNLKSVSGTPFLIEGPGEYEIKGVFIRGILAFHDNSQGEERGQNTIYTIETEGIHLCHLGDIGQKELTDSQLQELGEIDILIIPVGGVYTINSKEASTIISQIEPRIVIPMHYQVPKLKLGKKLEGVESFLKTMGKKSVEKLPKLLIKKKDLPKEETRIIVLNP
jgi:L-ascorbate metabolism protein UlaG (beta-lactamase superfamily)